MLQLWQLLGLKESFQPSSSRRPQKSCPS
jgi:hypothetical protein